MTKAGGDQVFSGMVRDDRWVALGVFAALFFVYWYTLCPTVGVGDSGELVTAVYTLGIPHPTGYPLYIILGNFFIHLFPFGEVAYRLNLFSALAGAGACVVFYRWMRVLGNSQRIAVSTALTLGLSLSFWSQATIARVYTLNALLIFLCIYYGFQPQQNFRTRAWFFFWWGMALANHTLAIIVGVLFISWWLARRSFSFESLQASLWMIPGLSFYLYLPLRSRMNPSLDIGNPETWGALWDYLSRTKYWKNAYVENFADVLKVIGYYLALVPKEFTLLGAVLILTGIYYLAVNKEYKLLFIAGGLYIMNVFLMALHGSFRDIFQWTRYLIPGFIGSSLFVGYGFRFWYERVDKYSVADARRPAYFSKFLGAVLPALLPLLLIWNHFPHNDRSEDYLAFDYNYRALTWLPQGAAVFPSEDNIAHPMMYLQKVMGLRPDVKLHISDYDQGSLIRFDRSRPLFFTHLFQNIPQDKVLRPDGLVFRLMSPKDSPPITRDWKSLKLRGVDDPDLMWRDSLTRTLAAKYWYFMALAVRPVRGDSDTEKLLRRSLSLSFDDDIAWARAGFYYYLEGDLKKAKECLLGALKINAQNKAVINLMKDITSSQKAAGK